MFDWTQCQGVERVLGKVSGAWVFKETPVPVRELVESLEDGTSVNDFLQWSPGATDEQVVALLEPDEHSLASRETHLIEKPRACCESASIKAHRSPYDRC